MWDDSRNPTGTIYRGLEVDLQPVLQLDSAGFDTLLSLSELESLSLLKLYRGLSSPSPWGMASVLFISGFAPKWQIRHPGWHLPQLAQQATDGCPFHVLENPSEAGLKRLVNGADAASATIHLDWYLRCQVLPTISYIKRYR